MLKTGITGEVSVEVTDANTAKNAHSGALDVFATPAMIALMEQAACKCLEGLLDEGMTSVGTKLDVAHTAATPKGMAVKATATLCEIDGRRLVFEVKASDEAETIGKGLHERFIVNGERFTAKTYGKVKS